MSFLKKIERILPWSFLGFVLGAPALYLTIHQKSPDIVFQKVAESNILDIHREMKDLTISFRGEDIRKSEQNLKFYIITVRNEGDKTVVQNDFDQNQVWGLMFSNSKIIETPTVIDSNSDYLKNNLSPRVIDRSTVELTKVIFETGKYATLEIKVLHDIGITPEISVTGKIAGIEKQKIETSMAGTDEPFWEKLFSGNLGIQIARVFVYFLSFILAFIVLIYLFELPTIIKKKKSKRKIREYLHPVLSGLSEDEKEKVLSFCGIMGGDVSEMEAVINILDDEDKLAKLEVELAKDNERRSHVEYDEFMPFRVYNVNVRNKVLSVSDDGKVIFTKEGLELLKSTLQHFKTKPKPENVIWFRR